MSDPPSTILFRRASARVPRRRLCEIALHTAHAVAPGSTFSCLFTDDRELRRLNREFLGHDYPTDVLSFPSPGPDGFLGEMAVSVDRAAEQAREYGHTLEGELGILVLHGLLHLLGMDHQTDRGRMARAEAAWRRKLGLPAGLIQRARL